MIAQSKIFPLLLISCGLFVYSIFLQPKKKHEIEICTSCDELNKKKNDYLLIEAEKYLKSLKENNRKSFVKKIQTIDKLKITIENKNVQLIDYGDKIKILSEKIQQKTNIDTVIIKQRKSFWGKLKTDTIIKNGDSLR